MPGGRRVVVTLHSGKSKALGAQRPDRYVAQLRRILRENVVGSLFPGGDGLFMPAQLGEGITLVPCCFGRNSPQYFRIFRTYMVGDPLPGGDGFFMPTGRKKNGSDNFSRRDSQTTQVVRVARIGVLQELSQDGERTFVAFLSKKDVPFERQRQHDHNACRFRIVRADAFRRMLQDLHGFREAFSLKQCKSEHYPNDDVVRLRIYDISKDFHYVGNTSFFDQIHGIPKDFVHGFPNRKFLENSIDDRIVRIDTIDDKLKRFAQPVPPLPEIQIASYMRNQNPEPFRDLSRTGTLPAQPRQHRRIHLPHSGRAEEIVKEGDEPFQTNALRAREAQQVVDVVETIADLVPHPLRLRQANFPCIALLHELPELGACVRGAELRGPGHLLRQHRSPPFRETVEHLARLDRQFLDPGFEVRCLFVDESFQIFESGTERRLDQHSTGKHQQPRVAARQPSYGFQPAALPLHGFRDFRPSFTAREGREYPVGVFLPDAFENEQPEEFVERLAATADGLEDGVGGTEQQDVRPLDQGGAQGMDFALVPHLPEDDVEILDEQDQPFPAFPTKIQERREGVCGEPLRVALIPGERVGSVRPSWIMGGAGQMTQGGEPEIREIADLVAFLVERDGLPAHGQPRGVPDRVQETQPKGGLSHAARADEHHVLAWPVGGLLADQAKHVHKHVFACDERRLQLVRGQLGRVVEPAAAHGAPPLSWYFRHHFRKRLERNFSRSSSCRT